VKGVKKAAQVTFSSKKKKGFGVNTLFWENRVDTELEKAHKK